MLKSIGFVDDQRPYECSTVKCGEQYCSICVKGVQGSSDTKQPFTCISCKKNVIPKRNILVEKHIVWKSMCKLYGIASLVGLKMNSKFMSCQPILKDIEFRLGHLTSRLNTFQTKLKNPIDLFDDLLIKNVKNMIKNLKDLINRVKETNEEMKHRGVIVKDCLKKYKKSMKDYDSLCNALISIIEKLEMDDNSIMTDTSDNHQKHVKDLYNMDNLDGLVSGQNINAVDHILKDLCFRKQCLSEYQKTIKLLLGSKSRQIALIDDNLNEAQIKLDAISAVEEELSYLRGNMRAIQRYIGEYDSVLRDDNFQDIPGSKFILLLENLRTRTEKLEISVNFPTTNQLMKEWQNDHGVDDQFKPKVIDLFKALEADVKHLFEEHNCIYSVPYKVGIIGGGSVGKSALIMVLANMYEFISMVDPERSTFGYLQFDTFFYRDPRNDVFIPITFVDIEGGTDTNISSMTGNYIELIEKADCDLYIIMFDTSYSEHNRTCQEFIEDTLGRMCLLVRSKADLLFNAFLQKETGKKYDKENTPPYQVHDTLNQIEKYAAVTYDTKRLSNKVYLMAAACDDALKDAPFATFHLDELKERIIELAITDIRIERICKLAIRASQAIINTCFRRGYAISKTRYRVIAAGAGIVPFLEEVPAFFGCEKICQAFGVHDSFAVINTFRRRKDLLEEYLAGKEFKVPEEDLKSGYFTYLKAEKTNQSTTNANIESKQYFQPKQMYNMHNRNYNSRNAPVVLLKIAGTACKYGAITVGTVAKVADDAARLVVPASAVGLRVLSITGLVVGIALTPVFSAWAFYSTGKRMNEHLHLLCNDLLLISGYFIVAVCNDCRKNLQLPSLSSSVEDSSSFEDE